MRTMAFVSGMVALTKRVRLSRTWGMATRDLALGGLDPAGPGAVARAGRLGCPFVAGPAQEGRHLLLDGPLDDELGTQAAELGQAVGIVEPSEEHLLDGFLDPGAGGYPSFHGVVLLGELPGPLRSLRRPHFSSDLRTPPITTAGKYWPERPALEGTSGSAGVR